jgi:hypothetical protein
MRFDDFNSNSEARDHKIKCNDLTKQIIRDFENLPAQDRKQVTGALVQDGLLPGLSLNENKSKDWTSSFSNENDPGDHQGAKIKSLKLEEEQRETKIKTQKLEEERNQEMRREVMHVLNPVSYLFDLL